MFTRTKQPAPINVSSHAKSSGARILRQIVLGLLILCMILIQPHEAVAKRNGKSSAENKKYAAIVMDAASGTVLFERNANKPLHPASLTKVMTLTLLFEALESGTVRLNDRITISQHAASQQPSKLGLKTGSSIRVEDAILAVVTKSANDMATAIAEHLSGSERRFAERMTRRAHDIGMTRTNFMNASGLHHPRQISTARDMATLARYVLARYPNYYRYFGTRQFTYRGKTMNNHNHLMKSYPGMDGFKTGFVNQSGFNLIASARRGEKRLIGVVFGGRTTKSRNDHMTSILNDGFAKMSDPQFAKANHLPPKTLAATAQQSPQTGISPDQEEDMEKLAAGSADGAEEGDFGPGTVTASNQQQYLKLPARESTVSPYHHPVPASDLWSVQIGAYTSRVATDDALRIARQKLPSDFSHVTPIVVPLKNSEGVLFRARLGNLSQSQTIQICRYFHDCVPIAPQ